MRKATLALDSKVAFQADLLLIPFNDSSESTVGELDNVLIIYPKESATRSSMRGWRSSWFGKLNSLTA
jgi:hypothetical protein